MRGMYPHFVFMPRGATDNRCLAIPRYGCSVADLYHNWRTHLSLGKDAPQSRRIQPLADGEVVEMPEVAGLRHHYERRAA
jgi:hypothetical protein